MCPPVSDREGAFWRFGNIAIESNKSRGSLLGN